MSVRAGGVVALLTVATLLPFVVSSFHLLQLTMVVIFAIALLGLNLLTGFSGQISLGHGAFIALGAYAAAILLEHAGIPYWLVVPVSGALCFGAGFLFGLPALRLEPLYLALSTFALAIATPQLLKFRGFETWTGGVQGIAVSAFSPPPGLPLKWDQWLYLYALAIAALLFIAVWNLLRSGTGLALVALRDHPVAASSMGIDVARYKTVAFGISAACAGIAGALMALVTQFVSPDSFAVMLSLSLLVGSVIGGVRSLSGAIYGAFFIQFVPNVAEHVSKAATGAVYGVLLITFMYAMPTGIAGFVKRAVEKFTR